MAAYADTHVLVAKRDAEGRAETTFTVLDDDSRTVEVADMLDLDLAVAQQMMDSARIDIVASGAAAAATLAGVPGSSADGLTSDIADIRTAEHTLHMRNDEQRHHGATGGSVPAAATQAGAMGLRSIADDSDPNLQSRERAASSADASSAGLADTPANGDTHRVPGLSDAAHTQAQQPSGTGDVLPSSAVPTTVLDEAETHPGVTADSATLSSSVSLQRASAVIETRSEHSNSDGNGDGGAGGIVIGQAAPSIDEEGAPKVGDSGTVALDAVRTSNSMGYASPQRTPDMPISRSSDGGDAVDCSADDSAAASSFLRAPGDWDGEWHSNADSSCASESEPDGTVEEDSVEHLIPSARLDGLSSAATQDLDADDHAAADAQHHDTGAPTSADGCSDSGNVAATAERSDSCAAQLVREIRFVDAARAATATRGEHQHVS